MARGGKRRNYTRDANGRFASTPGGGSKSLAAARKAARPTSGRASTLSARTSLKKSRAKLATKDPADQRLSTALSSRAQKGAVTRGNKGLKAAKMAARTRISGGQKGVIAKPIGLKRGMSAMKANNPSKPKSKKLARGPKARIERIATPSGAIRKSDLDKIKIDAQKGIGTPFSRASQRAMARSAREAPLIRKQAIAAAKRKGRTGFGSGPKMNVGSIGNNAFNWNRNEQPATVRERLAMWQKSERRLRGFWSGGRGVDGDYAGDLRASRRAARLVDSGNRLGNLPTTRKIAEQPRQRRLSRLQANRNNADLGLSTANRTIKPKIDKLQAKIKERQASGKSITEAQKNNLRDLTNQYNKSVRSRQVADAAKSYYDSPWTYKPKRMSGNRVDQSLKVVKTPSRIKGSRTRLPGVTGVVGKPKGLKPGALAAKKNKPTNAIGRKEQLLQSAQKRRAQADRIDKKIKALENEYRSKDSAFYTQGVKPAGRDKMIAKMKQAVALRDEAAALRSKADNAESMANRVKGTAAKARQLRRDAFDAKKYKPGDTIVTSQYGKQKITKISKNSVSFDSGPRSIDKEIIAMYLNL